CWRFSAGVEGVVGRPLPIELVEGDFLTFSATGAYDLVFNVGVVEHFLDPQERRQAVRRMFDLARPGGYVVSVVPSGAHPLRARMRAEGLGGYCVPEIDYTAQSLEAEMREAG